MTIRVYPSRLEGEPLETHQTQQQMTLREWLQINAPAMDLEQPQISVAINGAVADIDVRFGPSDDVQIWVEPRGAIFVAIIAAVVSVAISLLMRPKTPKQPEQGKALKSASLDANSARYGDPIPEVFGSPPRHYPDYLLPTRTYYTEPTVQWVEALLCIGRGEYVKDVTDVYIGDTRATTIGPDVQITFYEPGADLSGESAAQWWHSPAEVGFTSRGNTGMELGTINNRTASVNATAFIVSGDVISIAQGDDFPEDWVVGTELDIDVPYQVNVSEGISRDVIQSTGAFAHFSPTVGMSVDLGGDVVGTYKVHSYTAGGAGSASYFAGDGAPARFDFGTTPSAFTVAGYTVALTADYPGLAELIIAINSQLNGASVVAEAGTSGNLVIKERAAPYSGQAIVPTGAAVADLFGAAPTGFVGSPTGLPELTLSTLDDQPVANLPKGAGELSITPTGRVYQIVEIVTERALRVEPVGGTSWPGWVYNDSRAIQVGLGAGSQDVGWTGPFSVTPPGEKCTAFEFDLTFPQGLIEYGKKGESYDGWLWVWVQWRVKGSDTWHETEYHYRKRTDDGIGYTERIELPEAAEIEVRMRRSVKNWHTTNKPVVWTGLRGRMLNAPTSYEGVTTMAVKLRTGDRISSKVDRKIWLKVTRKFNGEPCRDIAPALLHIFDDCGYGREFVDMVALEELHEIWSARQDYFDLSVTQHTTVKTLANDMLRAGFAELTIDRGLLTPVRDALRYTPNYIYSPQEFVDYPTVTTQMIEADEIDGVDVEYMDGQTGKIETIQYRLPGDEGIRAEKIQVRGVTDYVKAWRLAARHRRTLAYRRTTFKGTTELHALNSSYMSYDRIQDGVPEYGQSCFVTALDGLVIRVSEPLDFDGNANRVIALRQKDGRVTRPVWVKPGPVPESVELLEPLPFAFDWSFGGAGNVDPTMLYFGSVRTWSHEVLITRISPRDNGLVDIEAVNYDPRVYADDDRDPQNEVYLTTEVYEAEPETSLVYAPEDQTSTLYPVEADDGIAPGLVEPSARWNVWPVESVGVGLRPPAVFRRNAVKYLEYKNGEPESIEIGLLAPAISRKTVVRYLTYDKAEPEQLSIGLLPPAIFRKKVADYLEYKIPEETISVGLLAPAIKRTNAS